MEASGRDRCGRVRPAVDHGVPLHPVPALGLSGSWGCRPPAVCGVFARREWWGGTALDTVGRCTLPAVGVGQGGCGVVPRPLTGETKRTAPGLLLRCPAARAGRGGRCRADPVRAGSRRRGVRDAYVVGAVVCCRRARSAPGDDHWLWSGAPRLRCDERELPGGIGSWRS